MLCIGQILNYSGSMDNSTHPYLTELFTICLLAFLPNFILAQQPVFDDFFGINVRRGNPVDKMEAFGVIREYHEWRLDEGYPGLNGVFETASLGYPNSQFKWNPSYQTQSLGINFDEFYGDLSNGKVLAPVLMQSAPYIINPDLKPSFPTANEQLEQYPLFAGEDPLDPNSYIEHADWVYQYVARFGNTTFSTQRQNQLVATKLHPDETVATGLGFIEYIEDWNEPNKWWREQNRPNANISAEEYGAMLSADFDGHGQTMGLVSDPDNPGMIISTVGAKNADPSIKMIMSGISDLDTTYIQDVIAWCENNRDANSTYGLYPFDVISYHHYSNVNQGLNTFGQRGISPEEDNLKEKLLPIKNWRDQNFPNVELWMSEFGWDTDLVSEQRAPKNGLGQYDQQDVQGQWLVRGYLETLAGGFDRALMYDLVDGCTGDTCGLYQSPGILASESLNFQPKKSYYYLNTLANVLTGKVMDGELSPCQDTVCNVDCPRIYRFADPNDASKKVFAIWSPTSCGKATYNYPLSLEGASTGTLVEFADNNLRGVSSALNGTTVNVPVSEKPVFVVVGENYNSPVAPCVGNLQTAETTCSSIRVTWDDTPALDKVQVWYLEGNVNLNTSEFNITDAIYVSDNIPSADEEFNITGLDVNSDYTIVVISETGNGSASNPCWLNVSTNASTCKIEIDPSWIYNSSNPANHPMELFDEQSLNPICGDMTAPTSPFGIDVGNPNATSVSVDLQTLHYIDAIYVYDDFNLGDFKIEFAFSPNGPWITLKDYLTVPFAQWVPMSNLISSETPIRYLRFTSDGNDQAVVGEIILCGRDSGLGGGSMPPSPVQNFEVVRSGCYSVFTSFEPSFDNDLDYFEITHPISGDITTIDYTGQTSIEFMFNDLAVESTYDFVVTTFDTDGLFTSAILNASTFDTSDCTDDCGNSCECFICLKPAWITNLTEVAGIDPVRLVDEQSSIAPFCGSNTGNPTTNWGENYNASNGVPPATTLLDLQKCHIISEISMYDGSGTGTIDIEYQDANGNWIALPTVTTDLYNQWQRVENLNIITRILRITKNQNQAKILEISLCGTPLDCISCSTSTVDNDGNGIPDDCEDSTTTCPTQGNTCNDGNACTENDIIDVNCNCVGTFADDDNDGVCNANDICNGFDDNIDTDNNGIPDGCDTGENCDYLNPVLVPTNINCNGSNDGAIDLQLNCPGGNGGGVTTNIALNKTATQSSVFANADASRAVDGNTDGNFWASNSVIATNWSSQPWWQVDLGSVQNIDDIEVWNRTDCCASSLSDYYIFVSDIPFASGDLNSTLNHPSVTAFYQTGTAATPSAINLNTSGRYIRIQILGSNLLYIAEVKVLQNGGGGNCQFTYNWDGGLPNQEDQSNLSAGIYNVTVTNATDGCQTTETVTITEPSFPLLCSATATNEISTASANDGSALATGVGGTGNYNYVWSNGATTQAINNLSAGTYTVSVLDGNNCICSSSVTLTNPGSTGCNNFQISLSQTNLTCGGNNDGAIDLTLPCTPSGGNGSNGSNIAAGKTATQSSTNLNADASRAVDNNTDGNYWASFSISGTNWENQPYWEVDLGANYDIADIEIWNREDCCFNNLSDYYIFVSNNPFTGTFNSILNDGNVTNFYEGGAAVRPTTIAGNTNGRYVRIQRQGAGFIEIAEVKIFENASNPNPNGCDLDINWSNGATTEDLSNLAGGLYSVTVTNNDDGCVATASATLTGGSSIACDISVTNSISSAGGSDGSLQISPTGGNGNLSVNWSNGATTNSISNLSAGTYSVTVNDGSGCDCISTQTLSDPANPPTGDYCNAQGNEPWVEWIQKVEFAGIDNTSSKELYGDFTDQIANVAPGNTYPLTLTPGYSWLAFDDYWSVWIDFNGNGSFDDAGEQVVNRLGTESFTEQIQIPASAVIGTTRMRVAMKRDEAPTSCETFGLGEVEDYSVNISTNNARLGNGNLNFNNQKVSLFDFSVYPSPTDGLINIALSDFEKGTISIFNQIGQVVLTEKFEDTNLVSFDLKGQSSGLYIVMVESGDERILKRVVVE